MPHGDGVGAGVRGFPLGADAPVGTVKVVLPSVEMSDVVGAEEAIGRAGRISEPAFVLAVIHCPHPKIAGGGADWNYSGVPHTNCQ